ncbi:hypothetical protein ACSQ67_021426 [Phaseolus vulgaris]
MASTPMWFSATSIGARALPRRNSLAVLLTVSREILRKIEARVYRKKLQLELPPYKGSFPKDPEIKGVLADFSNFVVDMKIQEAKDIPIQRFTFLYSLIIIFLSCTAFPLTICARDQIEYLTT